MKGKKMLPILGIAIAIIFVSCSRVGAGNIPPSLSVRGYVSNGDSVLIAGICNTSGKQMNIAVRALGPSLAKQNVVGYLKDPVLEVYKGSNMIYTNDSWQNGNLAGTLQQLNIAPEDATEPASIISLEHGCYTILVRDKNETSGTAVLELFDISILE